MIYLALLASILGLCGFAALVGGMCRIGGAAREEATAEIMPRLRFYAPASFTYSPSNTNRESVPKLQGLMFDSEA